MKYFSIFLELSIIKQKSLKVDQQLEISESKTRDLQLDIQKYTSKLELLNEKIYTKRKNHTIEESEYEHEQAELTERLKVSMVYWYSIHLDSLIFTSLFYFRIQSRKL